MTEHRENPSSLPPRRRARAAGGPIAAFPLLALALAPGAAGAADPIRALMVTGGGYHDYATQQHTISHGISARSVVPVEWTVVDYNGKDQKAPVYAAGGGDLAAKYDIIFHNECFAHQKDPDWIDKVLRPHREGVPAVVMHCAMHSYGFGRVEPWVQFLGVRSHRHGAHYAYTVEPLEKGHPVMARLQSDWKVPKGELYHIAEVMPTATPLAHARRLQDKSKATYDVCFWVNTFGPKEARVFGTTVGHYNEAVETQPWLDTVTRGFLWAGGRLGKGDEGTVKVLSDTAHATVMKEAKAAKAAGGGGGNKKPAAPQADAGKGGEVPPNLARGKTARADSVETGKNNFARHAVDGDLGTRWCAANAGSPYTWQVDMGEPAHVRHVRIRWEKPSGVTYKYRVEASADGGDWEVVADASRAEQPNGIAAHAVDAPGARHLRVVFLGSSTGVWGSFWEFEAYAGDLPPLASAGTSGAGPAPTLAKAGAGLLAGVSVPEGFKATIFAAPPDVNYPAALCSAPDGDVYVAIDQNGSLGKDGKVRQEIVRCVDSDGDGVADRFNVFAEKVVDDTGGNRWKNFNGRGLFFSGGKLWVLHPPFLRVFEDTDGDGRSDRHEVLVSGISTQGPLTKRGADHTTNGFGFGIDGWIYIAVGDFGFTEAVGKDGRKLQLYGGGVVRVRPDGTGLELFSEGQRNIYDVAVSPRLDCFTRDNTNDGGGWDVRLSHVVGGGADYGYPRLFKNFPTEHIQPLADYGGGSPCGSLFVDEPGFPGDFGRSLYTCDWGRSIVYQHPLSAEGASFTAGQQEFVKVARPTDMDVDGQGNLYISSWKGGGFSYKQPDVGFVVRVSPEKDGAGGAGKPFPDLAAASDRDLLRHLATDSHTLRLHAQLEILRRGDKADTAHWLGVLAADAERPVEQRVAAIFTLRQLRGERARPALVELLADPAVREFAVRALADGRDEAGGAVESILSAAADADPRVRLQVATALGRTGRLDGAGALAKLAADPDPAVAHVAVKSLVGLRAHRAAFAALDSGEIGLRRGALRALQGMHLPEVATGLLERLDASADADARRGILGALCRLYQREAEWNGDWWGTRPDTRGPYYKPVTWAESPRILKGVLGAMDDPGAAAFLLEEMPRNRIELKQLTGQLLETARSQPAFREKAAAIFLGQSPVPAAAIPLLVAVAADGSASNGVRARVFDGLQRASDTTEGLKAAVDLTARLRGAEGDVGLSREAFLRSPKHVRRLDFFQGLATDRTPARRQVGLDVLGHLASSQLLPPEDREKVVAAVEALRDHRDPTVRAAARKIPLEAPAAAAGTAVVAALDLPSLVAALGDAKGDAAKGASYFLTQGCFACHTVSPNEPLKGPSLVDIGRRNTRAELIESLVDPSAKIAPAFASHWFELKRDKGTQEGFVVRESGSEIEVRNVAGISTTIRTGDIKKRGKREISMMPPGLVGPLTVSQLSDFLAYLEGL